MGVKIFHDQIFTKKCARCGDRSRYCLHPKGHGYQPSFATMLGVTNNAHDYVLLICSVFVEHYLLVPFAFTNHNAFKNKQNQNLPSLIMQQRMQESS